MGRGKKSRKNGRNQVRGKATVRTTADCLSSYFAVERFRKSIQGADSAWTGFQRQTAYISWRIAMDAEADYYPETVEDLAIVYPDERLELVQIKSVSDPFALSVLAPGKEDSFFEHVKHFYDLGLRVVPKVAVFGSLGSEMLGFASGDEDAVASIKTKLAKKYDEQYTAFLADNLIVEACEEKTVDAEIHKYFSSQIEAAIAPKLFANELAIKVEFCSRHRQTINREWIETSIRDIALKAAALHGLSTQLGTTLLPLSRVPDNASDSDERLSYRLGKSAQIKHILAGFDAPRPALNQAINNAFLKSRIVLVRGASGQGKSTACYRYLYENGLFWAFEVDGAIGEVDARDVASYLRELSKERESAIYVYIDGASGPGWVLLAKEIMASAPRVRLLVSIREEDLNRSSAGEWELDFASVPVVMNKEEAEALYDFFSDESPFPSFDESWLSFGGDGPLLEYVFSLTHSSSLRAMIKSQIDNLCKSATDSQLMCLYVSSVLGAEGVKTSISSLKEAIPCEELFSFLARLENEHFLKRSQDGCLAPLHPYRSMIIAEVLASVVCVPSHSELLCYIAACGKGNIGNALVANCNIPSIDNDCVSSLAQSLKSWFVASEILKFFLWVDTKRLFEETEGGRNRFTEYRVAPSTCVMLAGGIVDGNKHIDSSVILSLVNDERRREAIKDAIESFSKCRIDYLFTKQWLEALLGLSIQYPTRDEEFSGAGFVLGEIGTILKPIALPSGIRNLESYRFDAKRFNLVSLLDFVLGLQMCGCSVSADLLGALSSLIDESMGIVWSRVDGSGCDLRQAPTGLDGSQNDNLVGALCAYRELYPNLQLYEGKLLAADALLPDDIDFPKVEKHIPRENLPINWTNIPNFLYLAMCEYEEAPDSWKSLESGINRLMMLLDGVLLNLPTRIGQWYESGCFLGLGNDLVQQVNEIMEMTASLPLSVPKESREPSCFVMYGSAIDSRQNRAADSTAVANGHGGRRSVFSKTIAMVNSMNAFFKNCYKVFMALKDGSAGNDSGAGRVSLANLSSIYESFDMAKAECDGQFGTGFISLSIKSHMLEFWMVWSFICYNPLRKRRNVLLMLKQRAKKLTGAANRISSEICKANNIQRVGQSEIMRFKMDVYDNTLAFLEIFDRALRKVYPVLDYDEWMPEATVLPLLMGPVRVDYYSDGAYCYISQQYYANQLVFVGERNHAPLALPMPADGLVDIGQHVAAFELYAQLESLKCLMRCVCEVNAAILAEDGSLEHLSIGGYGKWREEWQKEIRSLLDSIRGHSSVIVPSGSTALFIERIDSLEALCAQKDIIDCFAEVEGMVNVAECLLENDLSDVPEVSL